MSARKIVFSKDWFKADGVQSSKKVHQFEQMKVTRSEDLPQLMTSKEASEFLCRHPKTIEEYRKSGILRFFKIRGRYFTTPEFIAEFIENESRK